ncbi:hypothetical protein DB345_17385 [Spartobacteria bacterium LR76]|nr:hypothetical protein DB345_17385 [Spartobacteria bacterium LR76]
MLRSFLKKDSVEGNQGNRELIQLLLRLEKKAKKALVRYMSYIVENKNLVEEIAFRTCPLSRVADSL